MTKVWRQEDSKKSFQASGIKRTLALRSLLPQAIPRRLGQSRPSNLLSPSAMAQTPSTTTIFDPASATRPQRQVGFLLVQHRSHVFSSKFSKKKPVVEMVSVRALVLLDGTTAWHWADGLRGLVNHWITRMVSWSATSTWTTTMEAAQGNEDLGLRWGETVRGKRTCMRMEMGRITTP